MRLKMKILKLPFSLYILRFEVTENKYKSFSKIKSRTEPTLNILLFF